MKIFKIIVLIIAFLIPALVLAQSYGLKTAADTSGLSSNVISQTRDIPTIIGTLIGVALSLVGVYFFILILYAGFIWMTAAGAADKVESAKKKMTSAFIGLVIVLSAYALTRFIFDTFLQETNATCQITQDGIRALECQTNEVCKGKKCVSECDYSFKDFGGKCKDINTEGCDGRILSGLCPGGSSVKCCVGVDAYAQWEQSSLTESEAVPIPTGASEQNACEKEGNFCSTKTTCETTYNGKSLGQSGCASSEVCCKSCIKIGGACIDTDIYDCDYSDKNLKTGYCYGTYKAEKYKCCIGTFTVKGLGL